MWSRNQEGRKSMEMKVVKLIEQQVKAERMLKSLKLFDETGAAETVLNKDQASEVMDILTGYLHILKTIIEGASVYL